MTRPRTDQPPGRDAIIERKMEISKQHGDWTTNIDLGHGVYTLDGEDPSRGTRLRRFVQAVCDAAGGSVDGLRVLDLACLEGMFSVELARLGARVVGIEGREANVAKARFAQETLSLENLEFHQDDVRNLSEERYGRFDVILCLGILYHLNPPDVFSFVGSMASVCDGFTVIDTHASPVAAEYHSYDGREYAGKAYTEHALESTAGERLEAVWASLDNPTSLWITRPSLYNLLVDAGFTSVWECHSPRWMGMDEDRLTLLAIKGEKISSLPSAEGKIPDDRWPEAPPPQPPAEIAPEQERSRRVRDLEATLSEERKKVGRLSTRARRLQQDNQAMKNSRSWRLLKRVAAVRSRFFGV